MEEVSDNFGHNNRDSGYYGAGYPNASAYQSSASPYAMGSDFL